MILPSGAVVEQNTNLRVLTTDVLAQGKHGLPLAHLGRGKVLLEIKMRDLLRHWLKGKATVHHMESNSGA